VALGSSIHAFRDQYWQRCTRLLEAHLRVVVLADPADAAQERWLYSAGRLARRLAVLHLAPLLSPSFVRDLITASVLPLAEQGLSEDTVVSVADAVAAAPGACTWQVLRYMSVLRRYLEPALRDTSTRLQKAEAALTTLASLDATPTESMSPLARQCTELGSFVCV
jgi:hypothetical protein